MKWHELVYERDVEGLLSALQEAQERNVAGDNDYQERAAQARRVQAAATARVRVGREGLDLMRSFVQVLQTNPIGVADAIVETLQSTIGPLRSRL